MVAGTPSSQARIYGIAFTSFSFGQLQVNGHQPAATSQPYCLDARNAFQYF